LSCLVGQPFSSRIGIRNKLGAHSFLLSGIQHFLGLTSDTNHDIYSLFCNMLAGFAMHCLALRPEFQHFTGNHNSPLCRHLCQRIHHCRQSFRI